MRRLKRELLLIAVSMLGVGGYGVTHPYWAAEEILKVPISPPAPPGWTNAYAVDLAVGVSGLIALIGAGLLLYLFLAPGVQCPQCGTRCEMADDYCTSCGHCLFHAD